MTSVLYGAGLNYQSANPVRLEITSARRDIDALRKQLDVVTQENMIYRKHMMKLLQATESGAAEFTNDLMAIASATAAANTNSQSANSGQRR